MRRKKAKSGNNTVSPQFIYVMLNIPMIWLFKCGITGNVAARRKNISETTFGLVFPIWIAFVWNAYGLEQWLHRTLNPINVRIHGSGGSEWFFIFGLLFVIPILIIRQIFDMLFFFLIIFGIAVLVSKIGSL